MPNDITSSLMQGLDSGLSMQDILLSQIDASDPMMALLTRMISERSSVPVEHSDITSHEDEETDELSQHRLKRLSKTFQKLRHEAELLRTEVEELQLRNDTIAAALGACYLCWGEYASCEVCDGKGVPGHFPIQAQAFTEFVLPAIRSFKNHKTPSTNGREVEYEPIQSK